MTQQLQLETTLAPLASVYIPPVILKEAQAVAAENVHPAWQKLERKGNHFVIRTDSLDDLTEVADWARTALVEPAQPLTKATRQAYQAVVNRAARWAVLEPLGDCHLLATKWRDGRLKAKTVVKGDGTISNSNGWQP